MSIFVLHKVELPPNEGISAAKFDQHDILAAQRCNFCADR